jgi:hypothetical protein
MAVSSVKENGVIAINVSKNVSGLLRATEKQGM